MARTLIYRVCGTRVNGFQTTEVFWDTAARKQATVQSPVSGRCSPYSIGAGVKLDSWCEGSELVEVLSVWDGWGRPPAFHQGYAYRRTPNAAVCGVTPCGLKIDSVLVTREGSTHTVTILASGTTEPVEYSLNNFADVQDSNVFTGLGSGEYIAYARTK